MFSVDVWLRPIGVAATITASKRRSILPGARSKLWRSGCAIIPLPRSEGPSGFLSKLHSGPFRKLDAPTKLDVRGLYHTGGDEISAEQFENERVWQSLLAPMV
jgi:hypothetical protein